VVRSDEARAALLEWSRPAPERTGAMLTPLGRSEAEDALADMLAASGLAGADEAAAAFVDHGLDAEQLESLRERIGGEDFSTGLSWLAVTLETTALLGEIQRGAEAIGSIIDSVKAYSYMDRGPVQRVDVHKGIEDTLRILAHKLKHGVTVERRYAEDVPPVEAHGAELNQVWTNLIDNAIDAMTGSGTLEIETSGRADDIVVDIIDSGPGVPSDLRGRIFQPFFTTKEPGAGTGLGLHIAHTIVTGGHGGTIAVESVPGRTRFRVMLPKKLPESGH
jgi:signal transduction histidine kinase